MLSSRTSLVVTDLDISKLSVGALIEPNNVDKRSIASISPIIDTTNIHDIFGDLSARATYRLNGDATDLGGLYNGTASAQLTYDNNGRYAKQGKFAGPASGTASVPKVLIPAALNNLPDGTFSISFWTSTSNLVYANSFIGRAFVTSGGLNYGWSIELESDRRLFFYRLVGSAIYPEVHTTTPISSSDSKLVHVVLSFNKTDGTTKIYVDGVLVLTGTMPNYSSNVVYYPSYDGGINLGAIYLPGHSTPYTRVYNGGLSQMRIFNKVVSQDEVSKLFAERRYIIGLNQDLTVDPTKLDVVSSFDAYRSGVYFDRQKAITFDWDEATYITTRVYAINNKVKSMINGKVYECIKPNTIGIDLNNNEYFKPMFGISIENGVLAHANGKDKKNYLITEIEDYNSIITIADTTDTGWRYIAKYRDTDTYLLEKNEPVFTGSYTRSNALDDRVVLRGNKWYKEVNKNINILKNPELLTLTDWTGVQNVTTSPSIATPFIASNTLVSLSGGQVTLSQTAANMVNGGIVQSVVLNKGKYQLGVSDFKITNASDPLVFIPTLVNPVGSSWNVFSASSVLPGGYAYITSLADITFDIPNDNTTVYLLLCIASGSGTFLQTVKFRNPKLLKVDDVNITNLNPLSFLKRAYFEKGIPITIDESWTPPKVMQEDTLINGMLTTTENRIWMEIGSVYVNQRLVIDNPFGNDKWKDCEVKAYIWHPVTLRWEISGIQAAMNVSTSSWITTGYGVYSTSEGVIFQTGDVELIDGDAYQSLDSSYMNVKPGYTIFSGKIALVIEYRGATKDIMI